jgi:2-keto-3-deoxygluconate permease
VGLVLGVLFDPFEGLLGLSTLGIVAAMTNGNVGLFAGLAGA